MVLDLLLPGLQGDDFLSRMRANHGLATTTIVIVTLKDLGAAEELALQKAGAAAMLRKDLAWQRRRQPSWPDPLSPSWRSVDRVGRRGAAA